MSCNLVETSVFRVFTLATMQSPPQFQCSDCNMYTFFYPSPDHATPMHLQQGPRARSVQPCPLCNVWNAILRVLPLVWLACVPATSDNFDFRDALSRMRPYQLLERVLAAFRSDADGHYSTEAILGIPGNYGAYFDSTEGFVLPREAGDLLTQEWNKITIPHDWRLGTHGQSPRKGLGFFANSLCQHVIAFFHLQGVCSYHTFITSVLSC